MWLFVGFLIVAGIFYSGKNSIKEGENTMSKALDFIRQIHADVKTLQAERGIDPTIAIVQAAYESNFGLSKLSRTYHNLFGIKKSSTWTGGTVNLPTKEVGQRGVLITVNQYFKTYPTYMDSLQDWADLLQYGYPNAYTAAQKGDLKGFFAGLAKGAWGAYAGPADGSFIRDNYAVSASALAPIIKTALSAIV